MTADRAAILARIADECMENGGRLPWLESGMISLSAETYPPGNPVEVRFAADWPDQTIVCSRSLAGYSLLGGLHRDR